MNSVLTSTAVAVIGFFKAILWIGPHAPSTFIKAESVDTLSKSVLSLTRKNEIHLDILVTEDEVLALGVNKHISWIINIFEWKTERMGGIFIIELETHHI